MSDRFKRPITCLITNGDAVPDTFTRQRLHIAATVRRAVGEGVSIVQIREKLLTTRQLFELTVDAVRTADGSGTVILVNERADVAIAAGAGGVHLRSDSFGPAVLRPHVPESFVIGASAHTQDEVMRVRDGGADYVLFGPVFDSPGKRRAVGLDALRKVCAAVQPFPVLALGGIERSNADLAIDSGAAGVAAIRFFNTDDGLDYAASMRNLHE